MKLNTILMALAAAALVSAFALPAAAQQGWQLLGQATMGARIETEVIQVGRQDGRFRRIRLDVKQSDVEILALKVVYGNGAPEEIQVRQVFKAGSSSRAIELKGGDRFISQIIVTYRSRGPAVIQVLGETGAPVPPPQQWVELGCKRVNFLIERDVVPVGRKEGRFTAIRLRALGNRIQMLDLRVIYGNGAPDFIPVRMSLSAGSETKPLPLKGDGRAITQIEMIYVAQPSFKGQGTLCVDGRQ